MTPVQKENLITSMKEVDEASFEEKFLFPDDLYEEFLTSKGLVVTTLEENNEIVGYALSHDVSTCIDAIVEQGDDLFEEYRDMEGFAYSETFAIKPQYQNTGSFRSFNNERLDALRSKGYKTLLLHARQSTMSKSLQEQGYSPKRIVKDWFDGEDFDFYEITL